MSTKLLSGTSTVTRHVYCCLYCTTRISRILSTIHHKRNFPKQMSDIVRKVKPLRVHDSLFTTHNLYKASVLPIASGQMEGRPIFNNMWNGNISFRAKAISNERTKFWSACAQKRRKNETLPKIRPSRSRRGHGGFHVTYSKKRPSPRLSFLAGFEMVQLEASLL